MTRNPLVGAVVIGSIVAAGAALCLVGFLLVGGAQ